MRQFYKAMLDHLYDGVYFVDQSRKILYWNKTAEKIAGYSNHDMVGHHCYDNRLQHVDDFGKKLCLQGCPLHETLADGEVREAKVYLHHKNGTRLPVQVRITPVIERGKIVGAVEVFNDISKRGEIEAELAELQQKLMIDHLTGIPNRQFFSDFLKDQIVMSRSRRHPGGLIFIDIDHFKKINDQYGHNIGDIALKVVAETIMNNIRSKDMVARWGGEEFLLYLQGVNQKGLEAVAEKIVMLIRHSDVAIPDGVITLSISAGATLIRGEDTLESLVERADQLMYQSKQGGRDRFTAG